MAKKSVHTVPSSDRKGWDNKVSGNVVSHHRTKENAVEAGRSTARTRETEHVIHGRDGKIDSKNSYGNDPNPPKDSR